MGSIDDGNKEECEEISEMKNTSEGSDAKRRFSESDHADKDSDDSEIEEKRIKKYTKTRKPVIIHDDTSSDDGNSSNKPKKRKKLKLIEKLPIVKKCQYEILRDERVKERDAALKASGVLQEIQELKGSLIMGRKKKAASKKVKLKF